MPGHNPLVEAASTILSGNLPHNKEIVETINVTQQVLQSQESHLTPHGRALVEDTNELLESAKHLTLEKNRDEVVQDFIREGTLAASEASRATGKVSTQGEMRSRASEFAMTFRRTLLDLIRSNELREIFLDLIDVLQESSGRVSNKTNIGQSLKQDIMSGDLSMTHVREEIANLPTHLRNEELDPEKRDRLNEKFQLLIIRMSESREFKRGVDIMFELFDHMKTRASMVRSDPHYKAAKDDHLYKMWLDAQKVLSSFSGGRSWDIFYNDFWKLYLQLIEDEEVMALSKAFKDEILYDISDPQVLTTEERKHSLNCLLEWITDISEDRRYKEQFNIVLQELSDLIGAIVNDPTTQEVRLKLQQFMRDFALDSTGKPDLSIMQDSINTMRTLLVPVLTRYLMNIPIAKIEVFNPKYDFIVEDILFNAAELIPEHLHFKLKSYYDVHVQRLSREKSKNYFKLKVENIQFHAENMKFWFTRKVMPRIEDHGRVSVFTKGRGAVVKVYWKVTAHENQPWHLSLSRAYCRIDGLNIRILEARHNILDKLTLALFGGTIRKTIQHRVANGIIELLKPLQDRFNDLFRATATTGNITERVSESLKGRYSTSGEYAKTGMGGEYMKTGMGGAENILIHHETPPNVTTVEPKIASVATAPEATYHKSVEMK